MISATNYRNIFFNVKDMCKILFNTIFRLGAVAVQWWCLEFLVEISSVFMSYSRLFSFS